jgi:hypothetical protein
VLTAGSCQKRIRRSGEVGATTLVYQGVGRGAAGLGGGLGLREQPHGLAYTGPQCHASRLARSARRAATHTDRDSRRMQSNRVGWCVMAAPQPGVAVPYGPACAASCACRAAFAWPFPAFFPIAAYIWYTRPTLAYYSVRCIRRVDFIGSQF